MTASIAHVYEQMGKLKDLKPGSIFSVAGHFYEVIMCAGQTMPGGEFYLSYVTPGETKNQISEITAAIMRGGDIKTWKPEENQ